MAKYSRAIPSQKQLVKERQVPAFVLENPQVSVGKSVEFMKKLTVVAVSSIAYLRNIFPPDAFQEKQWDDQRVYILRGVANVPGAKTLIDWIRTAFELVHSHHLKRMILVINNKTATLEIYTFSFKYNHEEIHCDVLGEIDGVEVLREQSQGIPEDIARSIRQLLRAILVHTTTLDPLPSDAEISVKLHLDEDTPEEVLPQGFQVSPPEDLFNFPCEVETLKLGKVETRFANFALSTKFVFPSVTNTYGAANQEENYAPWVDDGNEVPAYQGPDEMPNLSQLEDEDEVPGSQVESGRISLASLGPLMSQLNDQDKMSDSKFESNRMPLLVSNASQLDKNDFIVVDKKAAEHDSNTTTLSEKLSVVSLNREKTIRCICECSDLFDDTIQCASCSTFQHKLCYKLLECHQVTAHVCVMCHNPSQGKSCSVPDLLTDVNRKESALYRQALMYCFSSSQMSCKRIMTHLKVTRRWAEKIFKQLDIDGCFQLATNKGHVRNIKLELKESILGRYFSAPVSSDSTHMDIEHSFVTDSGKVSNKGKRPLIEENEENVAPVDSSPQPKRRKILKTSCNLKNYMYNHD